jgi:hypothetical protein
LASIQKKSRSPSHFVSIQTSTVRTPRHRSRSNVFNVSPFWRSIQLAPCRTKKAECDLDLSKPKFSKNRPRESAVFCALRYYFIRAEPLKITRSASSSTPSPKEGSRDLQPGGCCVSTLPFEGVGQPLFRPTKRGSRGHPKATLIIIFQVLKSNRFSPLRQLPGRLSAAT